LVPHPLDDPTGEFVLGLLDEPERGALEHRLKSDQATREAVAAWFHHLMRLHEATPPEAPPPELWRAVAARIGAAGGSDARRRTEGVWLAVAPGVVMRMLYVDPAVGTRSAIMRMQAGSGVPAHEHDVLEECFVIDGSIRIGEAEYGPGDHVLGRSGRQHPTIVSPSGAMLLLHWGPAGS
jgi:anti-sigma factor ChrR (cupin superfamily)